MVSLIIGISIIACVTSINAGSAAYPKHPPAVYPKNQTPPYQKYLLPLCSEACKDATNRENCTKYKCLIKNTGDCREVLKPGKDKHPKMRNYFEKYLKHHGKFMCNKNLYTICVKKFYINLVSKKIESRIEYYNHPCVFCNKLLSKSIIAEQVNCPLSENTT